MYTQGYINSTVLYHNIVLRGLDHLSNLENVRLSHCVIDIVLIRTRFQELTKSSDWLEIHYLPKKKEHLNKELQIAPFCA